MSKHTFLGYLIIILLLPQSAFANSFEIAKSSEGNAVIYIFRPDIDNVHKKDKPTLLINTNAVANIPYASYVKVELPLGKYNLSLIPNKKDSKSWRVESEFELKESAVYFVAIWNTKQPSSGGSVPVFVPGYLVFLPIANIFNGQKNFVTFESVPQEIAEPTLENLHLIETNKN